MNEKNGAIVSTNGSALELVSNSGTLARYEKQGLVKSLDDAIKVGAILAKSGFFPDIKQESQAVAKILAGYELGLSPVASLRGIQLIKGNITLSANLIAALIKKSKRDRLYDYKVKVQTETECTVVFYTYSLEYQDWIAEGEYSYTFDEAKRAGLVSKDVWRFYPKAMLFSRCISAGAKLYCPDLFISGVYTEEEADSFVNASPGLNNSEQQLEQSVPFADVIKALREKITGQDKDWIIARLQSFGVNHPNRLSQQQFNDLISAMLADYIRCEYGQSKEIMHSLMQENEDFWTGLQRNTLHSLEIVDAIAHWLASATSSAATELNDQISPNDALDTTIEGNSIDLTVEQLTD